MQLLQMLMTVEVGGARERGREKGGGVEVKLFLVEETLISSGVAERETDLVG